MRQFINTSEGHILTAYTYVQAQDEHQARALADAALEGQGLRPGGQLLEITRMIPHAHVVWNGDY